MTAGQMKRIRSKLARAAELAGEANDLATAGHADYGLREITARAADDMSAALRSLEMWDTRTRQNAEAIARSVEQELEREELAHLEAEHGAWLDKRIAAGGELAFAGELSLRDQPDGEHIAELGGWPEIGHVTTISAREGWVEIESLAGGGWVRRLDLLRSISEMSEEVGRRERAAGWDPNP